MQPSQLTDQELLQRIGARLKEVRIAQNVKQRDLAAQCGLSVFSISQMETGHNTSLLSLLQVLRALDRFDLLEPLLREREIDPALLAQFLAKYQPVRKRVSPGASSATAEAEAKNPDILPYFGEEDKVGEGRTSMVADENTTDKQP